jgi:malonate-semialdehyde dehydrogenase (acetylating)/methylmalonate-semialdehyde dehydrogenase
MRCMALSTAVFVGKSKEWIPELVERARKLKVSGGFEPDTDFGPLITCQAKERVEKLIQLGVDQGANLLLDGRDPILEEKYKNGNFVGNCISQHIYGLYNLDVFILYMFECYLYSRAHNFNQR